MNAASVDIQARLAILGIAGPYFIAEEPAAPNDTITIYDTGGSDPFPDAELYYPTIQIRVRNLEYQTGYAKQLQILEALTLPTTFEINDTRYIGVWNNGDIISLGKDQNSRYIFTANYRIERQPL